MNVLLPTTTMFGRGAASLSSAWSIAVGTSARQFVMLAAARSTAAAAATATTGAWPALLHAQAAAPAAVEIDGPTTTSTVVRTPFQLFGREVNGMQRASANGEGAAWLGGGSRSRSRNHVGSSPYSSSPPSSFPFPSSKCCSHGSGRSVARRHVSGRGSASPTRHAFSDRRLVG